jgi:predicted dehydrogenase
MEDNKKIKWGILGCGKIAHKFASDLALSDSGVLHACASRNEDQAREFAHKYGAKVYFDNYLSLAACDEVDVIYIATPHSFHGEHTLLCIKHYKHVLCEKPMGLNEKQVKTMISEAKKHQVFLMEAMWTAFLPAIQGAVKMIHTGLLGDIRHMKADFGFQAGFDPQSRLFNPDLAGGSLLDIGIYPLFISLLVAGYPEYVQSMVHLATTGVDDECAIQLQYASGATASLYSTITCHTDTVCEIFGTKGKITIPKRFHEQDHFYLQLNGQEPTVVTCGKTGLGYYHEIEHVNDCIRKNITESKVMTHGLSQQLIKLMDEIRKQSGLVYPSECTGDPGIFALT